jgi:FMN phosphatase YigB (HAD superfamily)
MIETKVTAGQRGVRPEELDAVTIDAYGTLLELVDSVGELHRLAPECSRDAVERAFEAEVAYYGSHAQEARDEPSLAALRSECTRVFNAALGTSVSPPAFGSALRFDVLEGVPEAIERLRARGLALAVVANWDFGLHAHLRDAGLYEAFTTVVTAGEAGAKKPDAAPFLLAVERLGVPPGRVLHIGDHQDNDEAGALAAGLHFAPAPLADVDRAWA